MLNRVRIKNEKEENAFNQKKKREKRQVWEPIYKKYKANKSTRIHVTKEHNNQDITNKIEDSKLKRRHLPQEHHPLLRISFQSCYNNPPLWNHHLLTHLQYKAVTPKYKQVGYCHG